MNIIRLTHKELYNVLINSSEVGKGCFGITLFFPDGTFTKINKNLYEVATLEKQLYGKWEDYFLNYYFKGHSDFADREFIEYLISKQSKVKLSKFDTGIIEVDGKVCGTLPYYHDGYKSIDHLDVLDSKTVIILLRNLLEKLYELEKNEVYHNDLWIGINPNVLYRELDTQIIDFSDKDYIKTQGLESKRDMYINFLLLIKQLKDKLENLSAETIKILEILTCNNEVDSYYQINEKIKIIERYL